MGSEVPLPRISSCTGAKVLACACGDAAMRLRKWKSRTALQVPCTCAGYVPVRKKSSSVDLLFLPHHLSIFLGQATEISPSMSIGKSGCVGVAVADRSMHGQTDASVYDIGVDHR